METIISLIRIKASRVLQAHAALRAGVSRPTARKIKQGDPGRTLGQLLRYLEAIAPGMSLLQLLANDDPSLAALAATEKRQRARTGRRRTAPAGLLMAAAGTELCVFAHLPTGFAPAGLLALTEDSRGDVQASAFAYGTRYMARPGAFGLDPVSLSLPDGEPAKRALLLPANGLAQFGAIRDAAPDAWSRRVIEARARPDLSESLMEAFETKECASYFSSAGDDSS